MLGSRVMPTWNAIAGAFSAQQNLSIMECWYTLLVVSSELER